MSLIDRLKERHIVQWGVAYAAGAWAFLQVLDFAAATFGLGAFIVQAGTLVLVVGFFAVVVIAWYHGEQGRQRVSGTDLVILTLLFAVAGLGVGILDRGAEDPAPRIGATGARQSIAVLPFTNFSPSADDAYLAGGLTEEITSQLGRVDGLQVLSRVAVERAMAGDRSLEEVAQILGVGSILSGSVRKAGDAVRISAALVDATSNENVWQQDFDRTLADVFAMQTEIALAIAGSLRTELSDAEVERISEAPTDNSDAYDLFLRQTELFGNRPEENRSGIVLLRAAIDEDPTYVDAWARLGWRYTWLLRLGDESAADSAIQLTTHARNLDPTSTNALFSLANALTAVGRVGDGLATFEEGLAIDPGHVSIAIDYSYFLMLTGHEARGLAYSLQGVGADPADPNLWWHVEVILTSLDKERADAWLALAASSGLTMSRLDFAALMRDVEEGRMDEARSGAAALLAEYPGQPEVERIGGWVSLLLGDHTTAAAIFQAAYRTAPSAYEDWRGSTTRTAYAMTLLRSGRTEEADALFDEALRIALDEVESGVQGLQGPREIAAIHAVRGETAAAIEWLERVQSAGFHRTDWLAFSPFFDAIRDDPAFLAVVDRMQSDLDAQREEAERTGTFALIDSVLAGADPRTLYRPDGPAN